MKESNNKISIIDQFIYAVFKTKEYPTLLKQGMGRALNFAFVMSILITIMAFVIPLVGYQLSLSGLRNFFKEGIQEFTIEDGVLTMDGMIDMNFFGIDVTVDPSVEQYTANDFDENALAQILVSKHNVIIKNTIFVDNISFSSLKDITINNDFLVQLVPFIYGTEVFLVIMILIMQFLWYLLGAAGYTLVALSFVSLKPTVSQTIAISDLFQIGIYCKTLMSFLTAMNESLGYPIGVQYWQTATCVITFFYLSKGVSAYMAKDKKPPKALS